MANIISLQDKRDEMLQEEEDQFNSFLAAELDLDAESEDEEVA